MFVSEKQAAREAPVIPNELFTKAWASAVDEDGLGLQLVGATTEVASEADPVAYYPGYCIGCCLDRGFMQGGAGAEEKLRISY